MLGITTAVATATTAKAEAGADRLPVGADRPPIIVIGAPPPRIAITRRARSLRREGLPCVQPFRGRVEL